VEAKVSLNRKLRYQLNRARRIADYVLAVVGITPKDDGLRWCMKRKLGLWVVNGGEVIELLPYFQQKPMEHHRQNLLERINRWDPTVSGGLPKLRGVGIAQDVQRRVDEYRAAHPSATWKEIFANVPCHYTNYKNLYSSLRSNAERLALRARQRRQDQPTRP
jgi:hypothetical protein